MSNDIGYVNMPITGSIPIDKNLKRWLISRFRKLCCYNGRAYASDVFKKAREVCMTYRADPRRLEKVSRYERELPFRNSGWTKKILKYMDCQPMYMLDFLKLYCSQTEPVVTVSESADRQHVYLNETAKKVRSRVPIFLSTWLSEMMHRRPLPVWLYDQLPYSVGEPLRSFLKRFAKGHSYEEYCEYHAKWHRILTGCHIIDEEHAKAMVFEKPVLPEVYKDYTPDKEPEHGQSESLEYDYWVVSSWLDESGIVDMCGHFDTPTLSERAVTYLRSYLSHADHAWSLWDDTQPDCGTLWSPRVELDKLSGEVVGHIHHIPKKGTVKRRPIAVPNRFLQMGLVPIKNQLDLLLRRLPQDCTFNQNKFDIKISNRVTNPNLYVGSVDLSQATDNIPRNWGIECVRQVLLWRLPHTTEESWNLFLEMSAGRWDNNGIASSWPVGQPLGTLPSFDLLAITHNLLLEAMSFTLGYGHSPYCILGDDLLVFNKKLRKSYIRFMDGAGVPLSLSKSYENNLVEFAGKIYIRNQVPAYNSDHAALSWNNLFDYQVATGVRIPYGMLPRAIRRRFMKTITADGLAVDECKRVYELIQAGQLSRFGSLRRLPHQLSTDLIADFYVNLDPEDKNIPDSRDTSGILVIGGHPITYLDFGYAEKHGHLQRFRKVQLPRWYKEKFRPYSTDKLVHAATAAINSSRVTGTDVSV